VKDACDAILRHSPDGPRTAQASTGPAADR
jgi:hypothetical protein